MSKDIDIKQLPAFPVNMSGPCTFAGIDIPKGTEIEWGGMSLRDYFAAKAMQAYLSGADRDYGGLDKWAAASYKMADAMLEARK